MTDATATGSRRSNDRTLMIILAYLWLLALVPLLVEGGDRDVRWHARHGIVLTIAEFVGLTAWTVCMSVLWIMTAGLLGCLFTLFTPLLIVGIVIVHLVAVAKALQGRRLMVPWISEYANRF